MSTVAKYGLGFQLTGVRATLAAERSLLLDDLWTAYLLDADPDDERALQSDMPYLRSLVDQLLTALEDLSIEARELGNVVREIDESDFEEAFGALVRAQPVGEDRLREGLASILSDDLLQTAVIAACEYVSAKVDVERDELRKKIELIASGGFTAGDLSAPFKCAGVVVGIGGAITVVAASAAGGAGAAVLVGAGGKLGVVVGGGITIWEKTCGATWVQLKTWWRSR